MPKPPFPTAHLTYADHIRLAEILRQAQELLSESTRIISRAPYTDRTLSCQRAIQELLIDPLFQQHPNQDYPRTGYVGRFPRAAQ